MKIRKILGYFVNLPEPKQVP